MPKNLSLLEKIKASAPGARASWFERLTVEQQQSLLEVRRARQAGELSQSVGVILECVKEDMKIKVSKSSFSEWLVKAPGETADGKKARR